METIFKVHKLSNCNKSLIETRSGRQTTVIDCVAKTGTDFFAPILPNTVWRYRPAGARDYLKFPRQGTPGMCPRPELLQEFAHSAAITIKWVPKHADTSTTVTSPPQEVSGVSDSGDDMPGVGVPASTTVTATMAGIGGRQPNQGRPAETVLATSSQPGATPWQGEPPPSQPLSRSRPRATPTHASGTVASVSAMAGTEVASSRGSYGMEFPAAPPGKSTIGMTIARAESLAQSWLNIADKMRAACEEDSGDVPSAILGNVRECTVQARSLVLLYDPDRRGVTSVVRALFPTQVIGVELPNIGFMDECTKTLLDNFICDYRSCVRRQSDIPRRAAQGGFDWTHPPQESYETSTGVSRGSFPTTRASQWGDPQPPPELTFEGLAEMDTTPPPWRDPPRQPVSTQPPRVVQRGTEGRVTAGQVLQPPAQFGSSQAGVGQTTVNQPAFVQPRTVFTPPRQSVTASLGLGQVSRPGELPTSVSVDLNQLIQQQAMLLLSQSQGTGVQARQPSAAQGRPDGDNPLDKIDP